VAISAASQPRIVAMMLDMLGIEPGHRVLEAGAGTGYNAGLMGWLAGEDGRVVSIDVDDDIVTSARAGLAAAGIRNVQVVLGDGADGYPAEAPYDRLIATVGVWDLPPAWLAQLAPHGRLVVPLRIRGGAPRAIAFERDGGCWRSRRSELCGFMPLRGALADARQTIPLTADGSVSLEKHQDQAIDLAALTGVLDQPAVEAWTGVSLGGQESIEMLWLWLACTLPAAISAIPVKAEALDSGLVRLPSRTWRSMAAPTRATLPTSPSDRSMPGQPHAAANVATRSGLSVMAPAPTIWSAGPLARSAPGTRPTGAATSSSPSSPPTPVRGSTASSSSTRRTTGSPSRGCETRRLPRGPRRARRRTASRGPGAVARPCPPGHR
jgi:methyltransferase of FxLD system